MQDQPVVRVYHAQRADVAEEAFRDDLAQAEAAGYAVVDQIWTLEADGYHLRVEYVFQGEPSYVDVDPGADTGEWQPPTESAGARPDGATAQADAAAEPAGATGDLELIAEAAVEDVTLPLGAEEEHPAEPLAEGEAADLEQAASPVGDPFAVAPQDASPFADGDGPEPDPFADATAPVESEPTMALVDDDPFAEPVQAGEDVSDDPFAEPAFGTPDTSGADAFPADLDDVTPAARSDLGPDTITLTQEEIEEGALPPDPELVEARAGSDVAEAAGGGDPSDAFADTPIDTISTGEDSGAEADEAVDPFAEPVAADEDPFASPTDAAPQEPVIRVRLSYGRPSTVGQADETAATDAATTQEPVAEAEALSPFAEPVAGPEALSPFAEVEDAAGTAPSAVADEDSLASPFVDLDEPAPLAEPTLYSDVFEEPEPSIAEVADADPGAADADLDAADAALGAAPAYPPAPDRGRRAARLVLETLDLHSGGEPLRLIRSGIPPVPQAPILERRRWMRENADHVRQVAMYEPRGHRDMYGAILLPPHEADADIAVLFMHNEGYSSMCGHGTIAIASALVEEGLFPATAPETVIRFETPAGVVTARVETQEVGDGFEVGQVRFTNVPSYLAAAGLLVRPDGLELLGVDTEVGALRVDLAFGGAYYGIVDAADLGLRVVPEQIEALRRAGAAITDALRRDHTPQHPLEPDLGEVYGTVIVDFEPHTSPDGRATDAHLRNLTVFADSEVDRSPCGSGTSALLAQLHSYGRLHVGEDLANASITGDVFWARIEGTTSLGEQEALLTSVAGTGYVTGYSTLVVDARDPLGGGFLLR